MIDRICPKCGGRAAVTDFENERGQFARLWKCEVCCNIWGVPQWNHVPQDLEDYFGLAPWTER